jgi:hypothetical protein
MMAGGFLAASDPRYRRRTVAAEERAGDAGFAESPA